MSELDRLRRALLEHGAEESYDYLRARPRPWWRLGTERWPSREARVRFHAAKRVEQIIMVGWNDETPATHEG